MAASASGVVTFLIILAVGPACLALYEYWVRRNKKLIENKDSPPEGEVEDKSAKREVVTRTEYILGLVGYAIGIGNLWRFPFLCGRNGGAAFLVAYFICLFFVSFPAYMIEFVVGQYTQFSTFFCYRMVHPFWQGLGWAQAFLLFWVLAYYNILLAYSCVYIIGSLSDPFPWAPETEEFGGTASATYWSEEVLNAYSSYEDVGLGPCGWKVTMGTFFVWVMVLLAVIFGKTALSKVTWTTVVGPVVLLLILLIRASLLNGSSEGVEFYIGKFDADKLSELDVWRDACVQILFSLSPGMGTAITLSSFTKPRENVYYACWFVAMVNSLFSFTGGFAIFSIIGNITYKINFQSMKTVISNLSAATTVLATQSWSGASTAANAAQSALDAIGTFDEDAYSSNDALQGVANHALDAVTQISSVADSTARQIALGINLTTTESSCTLQEIAETARAGPGLAFIAIADGMQTFGSFKNVMSVLFFMTLLTLGLDSTFAWMETFISYVEDGLRLIGKPQKKWVVVTVLCIMFFLLGLPYCTRMGLEFLDTVDNFVGLMFLLLGVFLESLMFSINFGFARFIDAIKTASGVNLNPVWKAYWAFTTHFSIPLFCGVLFVYDMNTNRETPYGGYPGWMLDFGWTLLSICIILIPVGFIIAFVKNEKESGLINAPGYKLSQADKAQSLEKTYGESPPEQIGSANM